jgi:hypothetical protein
MCLASALTHVGVNRRDKSAPEERCKVNRRERRKYSMERGVSDEQCEKNSRERVTREIQQIAKERKILKKRSIRKYITEKEGSLT